MPDDTSDVGMMYRQFLQSRGVPINAENMRRAVEQSRREPGMIAGLTAQAPDPMAHAQAPPNVAGASAGNSGLIPVPPTPPSVPPVVPLGPQAGAQPPPQPPPVVGAPPPQAGQAPQPDQSSGLSIPTLVQSILGLGATGLNAAVGGPMPSTPGGANPVDSAAIATPSTGAPTTPTAADVGMDPATAPIGNILTDKPSFAEGAHQQVPAQSAPKTRGFAESSEDVTPGPGVGQAGNVAKQIESPSAGTANNYPGAKGYGSGSGANAGEAARVVRAPRVRTPRLPI